MLFVCRPEFSSSLVDEIEAHGINRAAIRIDCPGIVIVNDHKTTSLPTLIFERMRTPGPKLIPLGKLKPVTPDTAMELFGNIVMDTPLWAPRLLTLEWDDADEAVRHRLEGVWNALLREGRKIAPDIEKRQRALQRLKPGGSLINLILSPQGLWHSRDIVQDANIFEIRRSHRMKFDPLAPSRSYLKMEEAIDRLQRTPGAGEKVIDLGAAPGGWTYSFIRRGCDVIAVDHGPMKLPPHQTGWGNMTHIKENGITFNAPPDWPTVDWLVADMLIAPGIAQGLLRRWMESGNARTIVCNIKLPQEQPYIALKPILEMLQQLTGYRSSVKQLYHDRREVTVMAERVVP
ncbi:MAG TPA: SAM-dependent methyltransferase [Kiritimatiellia bacterium]|nr:SAM-dependent methyltransferase [Kiritimatiellia bacterium]